MNQEKNARRSKKEMTASAGRKMKHRKRMKSKWTTPPPDGKERKTTTERVVIKTEFMAHVMAHAAPERIPGVHGGCGPQSTPVLANRVLP